MSVNLPIQALKIKLFSGYFNFLNERQKEAVFAPDGPVLVIAGAGSGKTTVLINRISYLVRFGNAVHGNHRIEISESEFCMLSDLSNHMEHLSPEVMEPVLKGFANRPCPPSNILAITFTNKAAGEIKERLLQSLGEASREIWAGTFHSICVRLLRRFSDFTDFGNEFVIYDQDDCKKVIATILKEMEIEHQEITPKSVLSEISKAKNSFQTTEEYEKNHQNSEKQKIFSEIYCRYQKELLKYNALDFDDLIVETVKLLQTHENIRNWCRNQFRYILVDEYQDTNHTQYLFIREIVSEGGNIMVVGDDDQSIYKFRGASVENILNFDRNFPNTSVIYLEQNYRSTKSILAAANSVIANNGARRKKTLWSANQIGQTVKLHQVENPEKEALFIAETIEELVGNREYSFRDFAVLYRTKAQSNILETVFTKSALPHRLLAGQRFYDHAEVKDILAYLRYLYNPADFISLKRIINVPRRGIGDATVERIRSLAEKHNLSLYDVIKRANEWEDLKRSFAKLSKFVALIDSLSEAADQLSPSLLIHRVLDETAYMQTLMGDENEEKRKNVDELISTAMLFEERTPSPTLAGFLEEISLVSDIDNYDQRSDAVTLMTVHSAKGLEFPVVFIAGFEENLFPSAQSVISQRDLEEERRLAYVAMTRAKKELFITACYQRMLYGKTNINPISRFGREISSEYVKVSLYRPTFERRTDENSFYRGSKSQAQIFAVSGFEKQSRSPALKESSFRETKAVKTEIFSEGDRVIHGIFGYGTILEAKSYGSDTLYRIRFDRSGEKKLMATYAKLKRAL